MVIFPTSVDLSKRRNQHYVEIARTHITPVTPIRAGMEIEARLPQQGLVKATVTSVDRMI